MIHYHGVPIGGETDCIAAVDKGHAFLSFGCPAQIGVILSVCQSFAIDNGAFTHWKRGTPKKDWSDFYQFVDGFVNVPSFDWAIIPDVIDGSEADNDELVRQWPFRQSLGVPVWHYHESLKRLKRLAQEWPRVCLGSSGKYATVGTPDWWKRTHDVMEAVCDGRGQPVTKLHGLRMLNPKVFAKIPLASADSTNIGRNIGIDSHWTKGNYLPATKAGRAIVMRNRIEAYNSPQSWTPFYKQEDLYADC